MPARDRAIAWAANSSDKNNEATDRSNRRWGIKLFTSNGGSSLGASFDRPSCRQKNKHID